MLEKKMHEIGRSMVEMLGVLAIIGVLSIAGIATYQYAFNAYQAGQIQEAIGNAKVLASTDNRMSHAREVNRFIKNVLGKYMPKNKKSMVSVQNNIYKITTFQVPQKVCEHVLRKIDVFHSLGISVYPQSCEYKTDVVFSFDNHVVADTHFSSDNDNIPDYQKPTRCPDKQVWRQKDDGTYGCICRHEYEFGDDCTRCYPPKVWRTDIEACTCDELNGFWENAETCTNACIPSSETTTTQEYSFEFVTEHFLWIYPRQDGNNVIIEWMDTWDGADAPEDGRAPIPLRSPNEGSRHNYSDIHGKQTKCDKFVMHDLWSGSENRHFGISVSLDTLLETEETMELKEISINQISGTGCITNNNISAPTNQYTLLTYCPSDGSQSGIVQLKATVEYTVYSCPLEGFTCGDSNQCVKL